MLARLRLPRTAAITSLALVIIVIWTVWLASEPWSEAWYHPPMHRPSPQPQPDDSIPQKSIPQESIPQESRPQESRPQESRPQESRPQESRPEESTKDTASEYRVSKLHYLIPTTAITPAVCASVASALLNRYSIPAIVGYKGEGEYDAQAAHIAKLKAAARYLHNVPDALDDDLVIIVDGFDVIAQIPAEAMIQLYFDLMSAANQRVADRHGLTLKEARDRGLYESLLWGTDKGCFPSLETEPQCWLIPDPPTPHNLWGPRSDGDGAELAFSDSKFLNSGTVIGPLGDLRDFLDAANKYIDEVAHLQEHHHSSDQLYISKLYALQQFHRVNQTLSKGQPFPGHVGNRTLPMMRARDDEKAEFHVTVDFESAFTQTQCHNDNFMHNLKYDNWDNSAIMEKDALEEGKAFRPYHIPMPYYFYKSFVRIFHSIEKSARPKGRARDWVHGLRLGTNVATRRIFAFYHNTCDKTFFVKRFRDFWFFPNIGAHLRAAAQANRQGEPISAQPIDGRMWADALHHPQGAADPDMYGGAFTDLAEEPYLLLREACGEYWEEVFEVVPAKGSDAAAKPHEDEKA
ncbi:hypothetical protein NLU13_3805 [Sarocladium strictum]|uniref:Uncharacterized protein n=1 Tax=Sarocladium strictum TaxID=5046 RepID=A0AA39L8C9_SARSR|nr:hypothetical protein NLU13_3805 [Sarocladium strictum]